MSLCPSCNTDAGDVARFCPACGASIVRPPAEDDYTGRIIAGKFRVERLIGEGGMGKVFKATQLSLDKAVVLKVLRHSLLSDARTVARFQREAKAASRLNHPNSISVIDFGQSDDGAMFIAMEFVDGQDLHQILSANGPIPESRLIRVVSQVLSALSDAHAAGVIHRDLKPENIMVEQRRGESDFVKVLDFGIAKIQETDGSESQALTRAGFVCGTPEYMSPEQARGATLDARSDLYAVGVILYQCATNHLPFEADSAVALATMHLTTPPIPPKTRCPKALISPELEQLILRAMAKDPNDRPQSADEFRRELLAIGRNDGATRVQPMPQPPAPAPRPQAPVRRQSRVPPARSGEATQLARTPSWSSAPGVPDESTTSTAVATTPDERTGKPGSRSLLWVLAALMCGLALSGGALIYAHFFRGAPRPIAVAIPDPLPVDVPRGAPEPGLDANAGAREAPVARHEAAKARELIRAGDVALAAGRYDAALVMYSRAYETSPDAHATKRIALGYMLKRDAANADRWLRQYARDAEGAEGLDAIHRHLRERP